MNPMPYRIEQQDVDEVLSAYEPVSGGAWTEESRQSARAHVMRNVLDIDETVTTAPEDERSTLDTLVRVQARADDPAAGGSPRREAALAAIEDLLIRDGFLTISDREKRVFPAVTSRDDEHNDL